MNIYHEESLLVAAHIHRMNTLQQHYHQWRKRVQLCKRRRCNRTLALQHWSFNILHSKWLFWLQYIQSQRNITMANVQYSRNTLLKTFHLWKQYTKTSLLNTLSRNEQYVPQIQTNTTRTTTLQPPQRIKEPILLSTPYTNHTSTPPLHSSLPTHYSSTTTTKSKSKKSKKSKLSKKRSSRSSRSIGKRSWTAYKHAASKLVLRSFVGWSHQTILGRTASRKGRLARRFNTWKTNTMRSLISKQFENDAATHYVRNLLFQSFHVLHQHSVTSLQTYEQERIARRFHYFSLLRTTFSFWHTVLINTQHQNNQTIKLHYRNIYFQKWEKRTRPRSLVSSRRAAEQHCNTRMCSQSIHAWVSLCHTRKIRRANAMKAKIHYQENVVGVHFLKWKTKTALLKNQKILLLNVLNKLKYKKMGHALVTWWMFTAQCHQQEKLDILNLRKSIEFYYYKTIQRSFQYFKKHRTNKIHQKNQKNKANLYYRTKVLQHRLRQWHGAVQIVQHKRNKASKMITGVNAKHALNITFSLWKFYCFQMMPVVRSIYYQKIQARVLRYGVKWKKWAKKQALWRLVHSPLSTERRPEEEDVEEDMKETKNAEDVNKMKMKIKMKNGRTAPRCNMDLLASTDLTGVIRSLKREEGAVATRDMSKDKIDGESRNNSWMRDLTDLQKQLVELTSEKKNRYRETRDTDVSRNERSRKRNRRVMVQERPTKIERERERRRYGREDRNGTIGKKNRSLRSVMFTPSSYRIEEEEEENEMDDEYYEDDFDSFTESDEDDEEDEENERASVLAVLQKIRSMRAAVEGTLTSP